MIKGAPTEIHQILMNLGTNAKHAMELTGGVLHVSLHDVQLNEAQALSIHPDLHAGPYVHLQVRDTGHGMKRALLEKIFEPYFTTKDQDKGTGLGLSVVHGIVSNHGGVITVDSLVDKGTIFDMYFPRIVTQDLPDTGAAADLPAGTEHVLMVDDEPSILKLNSQVLKRLGYTVTTRASSLEALALFTARAKDFDIILTDMTMPGMRGDQLAEQCLKIRPEIPIILITGFSEIITEEKARKIGIMSTLMKPTTKVELATAVRSALQPLHPDKQENTYGR
jgi:CheY-like chemotaxis protein